MVEVLSQFTFACKSTEFNTDVLYNSITERRIWPDLFCLIFETVVLKSSEHEYAQI